MIAAADRRGGDQAIIVGTLIIGGDSNAAGDGQRVAAVHIVGARQLPGGGRILGGGWHGQAAGGQRKASNTAHWSSPVLLFNNMTAAEVRGKFRGLVDAFRE